jgi:tetratricopeptide (TPR) repeat protein
MTTDSLPDSHESSESAFPTPFHLGCFLARHLAREDVVRAGCRIAEICHERGQPELVSRLLEKAFQDARNQSLDEWQVNAFITVAETAIGCGDAELARKALGFARLHVVKMDNPSGQAFAWIHMADCHRNLEETEPMREALDHSLELAKSLSPAERIDVRGDTIAAYRRAGDSIAIAGLIGQAVAEAGAMNDQERTSALSTLADIYVEEGRAQDAQECLNQAAQILQASADPATVVGLCFLAKTYAEGMKNLEQARALAVRVQTIAQSLEAGNERNFTLGMAARAWLTAGDPELALACADQATGASRIRHRCFLAVQLQKQRNDSGRALQLLVGSLEMVPGLKPREKERVLPPLVNACLDLHALTFDDAQQEIAGQAAEQLTAEAAASG